MKKLLSVCLLLILIFSMSVNSYATISANLALNTSKQEYSKGDTFEVEVSLSNISSNNGGIRALGGYLEYDKTNLELVEFKGTDYWSKPSYNEEKGKFLTDRSAATLNSNETICSIVFKVKTENASNVSIKLKNIEIASVNEEQTITDVEKLITIKPVSSGNQNNDNGGGNNDQGQTPNPSTPTPEPEQNNSGNDNQNGGNSNGGSTEKPKDDSVANTILPAAGVNDSRNSMATTITLIIVVPIAVSLVAFVIIVLIVERRIFR